jgi:PhnB protein
MIRTSLEPWLSLDNAVKAVDFYKTAFGARESYRLAAPDGGIVVKLEIGEDAFWLSGGNADSAEESIAPIGGASVRLILTVADPDQYFLKAIAAGAKEVFPVAEEYGWRLGRVEDPFGLHWEIGHPLH